MASSIEPSGLSLADCPIPRAVCFTPARLIPQSPPLPHQRISDVLRSVRMTTRIEAVRVLEDTEVRGQAADFSIPGLNF